MNIIKNLQTSISKRLEETKSPCKLYETEKSAERAANKAIPHIQDAFGCYGKTEVQYLLIYVPEVDKWTVAFNLSLIASKHGGYLGIASNLGFYSF